MSITSSFNFITAVRLLPNCYSLDFKVTKLTMHSCFPKAEGGHVFTPSHPSVVPINLLCLYSQQHRICTWNNCGSCTWWKWTFSMYINYKITEERKLPPIAEWCKTVRKTFFFLFSQVVWCWDKWWETSSMLVFPSCCCRCRKYSNIACNCRPSPVTEYNYYICLLEAEKCLSNSSASISEVNSPVNLENVLHLFLKL